MSNSSVTTWEDIPGHVWTDIIDKAVDEKEEKASDTKTLAAISFVSHAFHALAKSRFEQERYQFFHLKLLRQCQLPSTIEHAHDTLKTTSEKMENLREIAFGVVRAFLGFFKGNVDEYLKSRAPNDPFAQLDILQKAIKEREGVDFVFVVKEREEKKSGN